MKPIDGIMIQKGSQIMCDRDLIVMGKRYFTSGKMYDSHLDNCLVDDNGEEVFVSQQYLPFFILKVNQ